MWARDTKETQTGTPLLLIFCYRHIVSDLLYNIKAAGYTWLKLSILKNIAGG
jgi:hypothetical protein